MTMEQIPETMCGIQLTGHGGLDKLELRRDIPVPTLAAGEVLIKVGACGINNTDINTRIGWYSKDVVEETSSGGAGGFDEVKGENASWSGVPLKFPLIQGADVAGRIVAVGKGVAASRLGERVMIRPMQNRGDGDWDCITFGSECNGGFAQYTKTLAAEAYKVDSTLTDRELASFPCAYSTAENMMVRSDVRRGDRVLITGASGGVGSAAVQLAKLRGAQVVAVCGRDKMSQVKEIGADEVIARDETLLDVVGSQSVDVVIDLVAGPVVPSLMDVLKRGGRYAIAGAIAGPLVEIDFREIYLKDLTFLGCTHQSPRVFENLVGYIEAGRLSPLVARAYPLAEIQQAQEDFLSKKFVGKLVLFP